MAHDFLAFRFIKKQAFELDFMIFQKVQSPKEVHFLHGYDFFSRFLLLSIHKKLLKISDHFVKKKIHRESRTLTDKFILKWLNDVDTTNSSISKFYRSFKKPNQT